MDRDVNEGLYAMQASAAVAPVSLAVASSVVISLTPGDIREADAS